MTTISSRRQLDKSQYVDKAELLNNQKEGKQETTDQLVKIKRPDKLRQQFLEDFFL